MDSIDNTQAQYYCDLLTRTQASDNQVRRAAELELNTTANQHPDLLVCALLHILAYANHNQLRSYAGLILRRLFLVPQAADSLADDPKYNSTGDPVRYSYLTLATQQSVKEHLLASLENESDPNTRHRVCDAASDLSIYCATSQKPWTELVPFINKLIKHPLDPLKSSGFNIIAAYPDLIPDPMLHDVANAFCDCVTRDQNSVSLVGLRAMIALISHSEKPREAILQSYLPRMLNILEPFYNRRDTNSLIDGIEAFIELAEAKGELLMDYIGSILALCVEIMNQVNLDDAVRHLGLEFILTLVDNCYNECRKLPDLVNQLLPIIFEWMSKFEEDNQWYTTQDLEEVEFEEDSYVMIGQYALDRLATGLGGRYLLPKCDELIQVMMSSGVWQHHHAALFAIATIGEGCYKLMLNSLPGILDLILNQYNHQHPRVRHAALNAMGQLANDFPEDFAQKYHPQLLNATIPMLGDHQFPRIQAHAAAALLNLCERLDKIQLDPYLDLLLGSLTQMLNLPQIYIQEQALTTIASIADSAEDKFAKYYMDLMPGLFRMMMNYYQQHTGSNESVLPSGLCARAIECSSLIGLAVGYEKFQPDINQYAQLLIKLEEKAQNGDDMMTPYLQQAWTRVGMVLGSEFEEYLPHVLPPLIKLIYQKPEVVILDRFEEDVEERYPADLGWEFRKDHGQNIGIRTSVMEDQAAAMEMVLCYAQSLTDCFSSYAKELIPKFLTLFNFYFHPGVRHTAIRAIATLVQCIVEGGESDESELLQLYLSITQVQLRQLTIEHDLEFYNLVLTSHHDVLDQLGSQVAHLNCDWEEHLKKLLQTIYTKLESILVLLGQYAMSRQYSEDDEDEEQEQEVEFSLELLSILNRSIPMLILFSQQQQQANNNPSARLLLVLELLNPMVHQLILPCLTQPHPNPNARQFAIQFFAQVAELHPISPTDQSLVFDGCFIQPTLNLLNTDPSRAVLTAAVELIGTWAKFGGEAYQEFSYQATNILLAMLSGLDIDKETDYELIELYDELLNSLTCQLTYFADSNPNLQHQILPLWFSKLPIRANLSYIPAATDYLLSMVSSSSSDSGHQLTMGNPASQLRTLTILLHPIVSDLIDITSFDESAILNTLIKGIKLILNQYGQNAELVERFFHSIPQDKKEDLQKLLA